MKRPLTALAVVLIALLALGLYQLKYEVMHLEDRAMATNRAIAAERETIQVLKAEWSYLNRPQRLDDLAERHLNLVPVAVRQLGALDELVLRHGVLAPNTGAVPLPKPRPQGGRSGGKRSVP